jgi:hypothetical protein
MCRRLGWLAVLAFSLLLPATARAQTGTITTIAGGGGCDTNDPIGDGCPATQATLLQPDGVFADASGNVFIADERNCVVREVMRPKGAPTGIIQTVAGVKAPPAQPAPVCGVAGVIVGDGGPATSAILDQPHAVFVDGSGNIFITDTLNNVIRKVSGGIIQTIAGGGSGTCPTATDVLGDGCLATEAKIGFPEGVFVDRSGNIFFADRNNSMIREVVASTGLIKAVAGNGTQGYNGDNRPATSAELDRPHAVFVDDSANVFIADTHNCLIREVVAATGSIQTVAGVPPTLMSPGPPPVFGPRVCGFNSDGVPATSAKLNLPQGVLADAFGNLFIADSNNERIRKVTVPISSGIIETIAGNGTVGFSGDGGLATLASFNNPRLLALDPSGNLLIADANNNRVRSLAGAAAAFALTAVPPTLLTVIPGDTAQYTLIATGSPGLVLNLSCSSAGPNTLCRVNGTPTAMITIPSTGTVTVNLTVLTNCVAALPWRPSAPAPFQLAPLVLLWLATLLLFARLSRLGRWAPKSGFTRTAPLCGMLLLLLLVLIPLWGTGCVNNRAPIFPDAPTTPVGTYNITVFANGQVVALTNQSVLTLRVI